MNKKQHAVRRRDLEGTFRTGKQETWIPPRSIEELAYTKLLSQLHGSGSILVSIIRDRLRFTGQIDRELINIYN